MNEKQKFLDKIKDGKWFQVKNNYDSFLVKMKPVALQGIDTFIETLWLSNTDYESMCFSEYDSSCWKYENGEFITYGANTYHFGSTEGSSEESIYTEECELNIEKMKETILRYARKDFINETELNEIWDKIESKDIGCYEELTFL